MKVYHIKTKTFLCNVIGTRLTATQFISSLNTFLNEQLCKEINMSIYKWGMVPPTQEVLCRHLSEPIIGEVFQDRKDDK